MVHGRPPAGVVALADVDLEIGRAETVALWGRSGSGKTTLLHALGGLLTPTSGEVLWGELALSQLDSAARSAVRAGGISYIFQGSSLLAQLTAFENVALALLVAQPDATDGERASELLTLVGLDAKLEALPSELSGGESQRVAIARALVQQPQLLLCDEPTGQLDSDTAGRILDLVDALQARLGFSLVVATHNADVAARLGRVVELSDGRVAADVRP